MFSNLSKIIGKFSISFQPNYKQQYEKFKDKNVFKPTDTEMYKAIQENIKTSSDVSCQNL